MRIRCPNCHHGLEIVPDTPAEFITCPSCGSQLDPNSGETVTYKPETRRMIGHFELLEHVGRGHFGNVWRARDTQLKRIVAVKIPRTADLTESDRQLFLREAQTAAKLRHANIVTVYQVSYDEDAIFIVSDFIQGVPLSEQLKIRQPSFTEAARWCAAIADALDYAHEQGVVHRDMKPGNVMLEGEDKLFVLDFGLAKTEGGDFTITTEGEILGTPAYMSPEQARGDAASADRRSDVYSLGVMLYEMLTGEKPFKGGTRSLVHQILNEEPKSPRRLKRDVPRDLETICLRAMAKEPGRRYPTAKEMADDLRRYLAGEPIRARPVRWPERSWRWMRRNPVLSVACGIAAFAFLLIGGLLANGLAVSEGKKVKINILTREHADLMSAKLPPRDCAVVFWRLNPLTGDPDLAHPVSKRGSSIHVRLLPGDYLVVADVPQHGFHEVYRHVPRDDEPTRTYPDNPRKYTRTPDGTVELPDVEIPPQAEVEATLVKFHADQFTMGTSSLPDAPPHTRHIAAFFLEPHEVSFGDFNAVNALTSEERNRLKKNPALAKQAITPVSWDRALAYAEKVGRRLVDEGEFEAAATDYGRQANPSNNEPSPSGPGTAGGLGNPEIERTNYTPQPIWNLRSGVAEWTGSWDVPYPPIRKSELSNPSAGILRIVRGGSPELVEAKVNLNEGPTNLTQAPVDPRQRFEVHRSSQDRAGIGFRCARSVQARLTAEDFGKAIP